MVTENRLVVAWGGGEREEFWAEGGADKENFRRMMSMFIILVAVIVSWVWTRQNLCVV